MKPRYKEIRKQPSAGPSTGGISALQQNSGIFTSTGIIARLFPYRFISSFHSTPEHSTVSEERVGRWGPFEMIDYVAALGAEPIITTVRPAQQVTPPS